MYLNDAAAKHPEFEGIACHHEQACGIAAEAYGRTGRQYPALALPWLLLARFDKYNHLCRRVDRFSPDADFIRQAKKSDRICGRPVRQGGVQEVDIESIVKPITKYAITVDDVADVAHCLDKALYHMRQDRSGPV